MTIVALACAFFAAIAYGVGAVLQDIAASRAHDHKVGSVDPKLLLRLARDLPYVIGLVLDALGFAAALVALRQLPLFAVQACVASSIAVTALVAWRLGRATMRRGEVGWLVAIGAGLLLLALSAGAEAAGALPRSARIGLVVGVPVIVVAALIAARAVQGSRAGVLLAALGGLAFGGTAIAARGLEIPHPWWHLVTDPVALALAAYGALGMLLFATALQRGVVTTATGALFAAQTVGPALVGLLVLGDHARPGWEWAAVAGFVVAVVASVVLALTSDMEPPPVAADPSAVSA